MSLQDDIFDVMDVVEGTPDEEAFDRIVAKLSALEQEVERLQPVADALAAIGGMLKK